MQRISTKEILKNLNRKLNSIHQEIRDLKTGTETTNESLEGQIKAFDKTAPEATTKSVTGDTKDLDQKVKDIDSQIKAMQEDIYHLKGTSQAQIWILLGILIAVVGGVSIAIVGL